MNTSIDYILTHAEDVSRYLARQDAELAETWARIADLERALAAAQNSASRWRTHRWWHHLMGGSLHG